MVKGDTFSKTLTINTNGSVQDITNWTVYFTIKNNKDDTDANAVYQQIIGPGSHTIPASGQTTLTIAAGSSSTFQEKVYFYDIQTKNTANEIKTPTRGKFTVSWDITDTTS